MIMCMFTLVMSLIFTTQKIFAYTQYQVKKGNESEPLSLGFEFDYDLATQKVNSYKIVTFSTTDVLASEGSNL